MNCKSFKKQFIDSYFLSKNKKYFSGVVFYTFFFWISSSEVLDAGKLSADRGRNLVRRTVIRRKKYSDRSKKLKKRENDADALQRLKFENETVKNGKPNQKEQVKHFWKKKRQIRAFKESGNTIYETGTARNVTLSNTEKLKGMLKSVFSGSKRTKMAVFSIGLIFSLLITSCLIP